MISKKERPKLRAYIEQTLLEYPAARLEDFCNGFVLDNNNSPIFMMGSIKTQARKMFEEKYHKSPRKYTYYTRI